MIMIILTPPDESSVHAYDAAALSNHEAARQTISHTSHGALGRFQWPCLSPALHLPEVVTNTTPPFLLLLVSPS